MKRTHARDTLGAVARGAFLGTVVGLAAGAAAGLAGEADEGSEWGHYLGTGALVGLGVGGAAGAVLAITDRGEPRALSEKVATVPLASGRF